MNHTEYYIMYQNEDGFWNACIPQASSNISVKEIARKDVPLNKPFWYLPVSQFPQSGTEFFQALSLDTSIPPDGYGIGPQRWFIEKAQEQIDAGINVEKNQALIQQMKDEVFKLEGIRL